MGAFRQLKWCPYVNKGYLDPRTGIDGACSPKRYKSEGACARRQMRQTAMFARW